MFIPFHLTRHVQQDFADFIQAFQHSDAAWHSFVKLLCVMFIVATFAFVCSPSRAEDKAIREEIEMFVRDISKKPVFSRERGVFDGSNNGKEYLRTLREYGLSSIPVLIELVEDSDRQVRLTSIDCLKIFGESSRDAVPVLRKALQSPDLGISRRAADCLIAIGPAAKEAAWELVSHRDFYPARPMESDYRKWAARRIGISALPVYRKKMARGNASSQIIAAEAIGALGDQAKAALPELLEAITDHDHRVRLQAAKSLALIGKGDDRASSALLARLTDAKEILSVRIQAIECLRIIDSSSSTPLYLKLLKTEPEAVVKAKLANILGINKRESKTIVPALIAAMSDTDLNVRIAAMNALGRYGEAAKEAVPLLIEKLAKAPEIVETPISLVTYQPPPAAPPRKGKIYAVMTSPVRIPYNHFFVLPIKREREKRALQLRQIAEREKANRDAIVKELKAVMSTLGDIGAEAKPAVPHLVKRLRSPLQKEAARALGNIGPDAKFALPELAKCLGKGGNRRYAITTASAMAAISQKSLPLFLEVLEREDELHLAATIGIRKLGSRAASALPQLKRLRDATGNGLHARRLDSTIKSILRAVEREKKNFPANPSTML